jgi:fructan beta-fructosidase
MRRDFTQLTFTIAALFALSAIATAEPRLTGAAPATNERIYQESLRPQFHFTARRNWLNDPNGLIFYRGEYHLFFQHNPFGTEWGNMTWGHAVSADLVHWRQLKDAIKPDTLGTIFSGSAVVDWQNTAGFQSGDEPAMVAIYTAAGGTSAESKGLPFTQCLAYSNDRGRSWTKFAGNPVLPHREGENRDPKVIWHEPTRSWVMALYLDGNEFALFRSPDLKSWTQSDRFTVPGSIECPDLFELPVAGQPGKSKWIFWTANNVYLVGDFDGKKFARTERPQRFEFGANRFAAQTFSDLPSADGRRVQIAWMRGGKYPEMPFNQQLSFPVVLTLHESADGYRLCSLPAEEIATLRGKPLQWQGELNARINPLESLLADICELKMTISPFAAKQIILNLRGIQLAYDVGGERLSLGKCSRHVALNDGKLELHILVDRTSIEVFAGDGSTTISNCFLPDTADIEYRLRGKGANVGSLTAWPLSSVWVNSQE